MKLSLNSAFTLNHSIFLKKKVKSFTCCVPSSYQARVQIQKWSLDSKVKGNNGIMVKSYIILSDQIYCSFSCVRFWGEC